MKSLSVVTKIFIAVVFIGFSVIASAQNVTATINYSSQVERVLGVLLLMLAGIFAIAWLMKKMGVAGYAASSELTVKASLPLSKKDKLYVIQVGEEQILIGVNAGAITPLKTLDKPLVNSASITPSNSDFSQKIQAILTQKLADSKSV